MLIMFNVVKRNDEKTIISIDEKLINDEFIKIIERSSFSNRFCILSYYNKESIEVEGTIDQIKLMIDEQYREKLSFPSTPKEDGQVV